MTVDSCFLATEDTLIVNENDPGAIIFKEKDEACHNTLEVEYFSTITVIWKTYYECRIRQSYLNG